MLKDSPQLIERYSSPSELDTAPRFSMCITPDGSVWVQTADNDEVPVWFEFKSMHEAASFVHLAKR